VVKGGGGSAFSCPVRKRGEAALGGGTCAIFYKEPSQTKKKKEKVVTTYKKGKNSSHTWRKKRGEEEKARETKPASQREIVENAGALDEKVKKSGNTKTRPRRSDG